MSALRHPADGTHFQLPEPPPRDPDEATSYDNLHATGNSHHLIQYFGRPESTLVTTDHYVAIARRVHEIPWRVPDLLIAFDVDPELYLEQNGYVIADQGKPPDFVLEVASPSTAHVDTGEKRENYAALGIPEYWRFDETSRLYGDRLVGERLVDGQYVRFPLEELPGGAVQGYSPALKLNLRWEHSTLGWYVPETGLHIPTFDDQRARAEAAEARAETAEARVRQLEAELERLRRREL